MSYYVGYGDHVLVVEEIVVFVEYGVEFFVCVDFGEVCYDGDGVPSEDSVFAV